MAWLFASVAQDLVTPQIQGRVLKNSLMLMFIILRHETVGYFAVWIGYVANMKAVIMYIIVIAVILHRMSVHTFTAARVSTNVLT
jgi:CRISPR/Cas system-associated endonuclease Cas3-HD